MYLNYLKENEKIIIGSYCNEMGLNDISFNLKDVSIPNLASEFLSISSKKITILEFKLRQATPL